MINIDPIKSNATTTIPPAATHLWSCHSPLLVILVIVTLHTIALALILTPLTDLVADIVYHGQLQDAAIFLSILEGVVAAMQFFTDPLWGHLSDTLLGRKPPVLLAILQFSLEMFILSMWPSWWSLVIMGVLRGICGVGFTICSILLMDLAGDHPKLGPRLMGYYGAASGVGFLVGALGGVVIGQYYGVIAPFICAGLVEIVNAIWIVFLLPSEPLQPMTVEEEQEIEEETEASSINEASNVEEDNEEAGMKSGETRPILPVGTGGSSTFHSGHASYNPFYSLRILISSRELGWLSLTFFLAFLGRSYARVFFIFTKYQFRWNMISNGLFLAFLGLLSIIVQGGCMKRMLQICGEERMLYISFSLNTLAVLTYSFLPADMVGAYVLYGISFITAIGFLFLPLLRAMMSREVGGHSQGLLGGAVASLVTAANFIGSLIYGPLFAYFTASKHSIADESSEQDTMIPPMPRLGHAPIHFPGAPFLASTLIYLLTLPILWYALKVRREDAEERIRRKLHLINNETSRQVRTQADRTVGYQEEDN